MSTVILFLAGVETLLFLASQTNVFPKCFLVSVAILRVFWTLTVDFLGSLSTSLLPLRTEKRSSTMSPSEAEYQIKLGGGEPGKERRT